jgi:transcriptional regulator with XRE-family HTH domain
MNLGKAIRLCRNQRGMTQGDLASKCELSVSYLSMIEKGKRDPTLSTLESIAASLRVPLSILVFLGTDESDLRGVSKELIEKLSHASLSLIKSK